MSKISATALGQIKLKKCKTCGKPIAYSIHGECMECYKPTKRGTRK